MDGTPFQLHQEATGSFPGNVQKDTSLKQSDLYSTKSI
jgi:hypothetical protein